MYPQRIVCLTEESVETLYLLGLQDRIVGVSCFVERPVEAKQKEVVTSFTNSNIEKIIKLKPDLVLGYSDIQKDIAKTLIGEGLDVWISNHKSIEEILRYINMLGGMLGVQEKAEILSSSISNKIQSLDKTNKFRCYIEEWDEPIIVGSKWFSEVIELAGGKDIYKDYALKPLAKDRIVDISRISDLDPEFIFLCWCGKKVNLDKVYKRPEFFETRAYKNKKIFELDPSIFLQPGPAPLLDGIDIIQRIFNSK